MKMPDATTVVNPSGSFDFAMVAFFVTAVLASKWFATRFLG